MIESMIIALREGVEIALVIGILVVYLQKIQQFVLVRSVYTGLALALFASIGGAIIVQKLGIDQESLEGIFQLVAALFVISMVIWMWMTAKKIRKEIEERVNTIITSKTSWRSHLSIMSFTFFMIVREGIETAIFLQAVALNTGAWKSVMGTLIGVSIATVFAVLFIRGSVKIDITRFLKVTAVTLIIFTFQLIANAFHEFYEYGIFPANPKMMGILGPLVQHEILFIMAIISIPAFMLIIPGRQSDSTSPNRNQRTWQLTAGIVSVCIIFFLGVGDFFSTNRKSDLSSETITASANGIIGIPVSSVGDNALHRYSITIDSLEIRFFVLRTSVGKFATAFDACYACYSYGRYYLKDGELICSQCDAPSPISSLHPTVENEHVDENNSGSMEGNGCKPIYLPSRMHDGTIEIRVEDLQSKRKYFDITQENH
jgi:FTR1 family protein